MTRWAPEPVSVRFLRKFEQSSEGCWEWTAKRNMWGYGQIKDGKKTISAHRISYEHFKCAIPDGMLVLHRCDNPSCVNPDHLFLGTHADNMADRKAKKRQLAGSAHHRAKLNDDDVRIIRAASGVRQQDLAERFGVGQTVISRIRLRKSWTHI